MGNEAWGQRGMKDATPPSGRPGHKAPCGHQPWGCSLELGPPTWLPRWPPAGQRGRDGAQPPSSIFLREKCAGSTAGHSLP